MKKLILCTQWLVGLLFIFSGLIKMNDPLGLSYKMDEFFEVWGWVQWLNTTLLLAQLMNILEVVCGIALLIGFLPKIITRLLLLLILLFTFLTAYALFSGKIKTCGCLGDCLPLTAMHSFIKDAILLLLIILLSIYHKIIRPLFQNSISLGFLSICIVLGIIFQQYVLQHLPVIDCLPYKVGNNIVQQMEKPANYVPDSTIITYTYKKSNAIIQFDQDHFPNNFDSTYEFVSRKDKVVKAGSKGPAIIGFSLTTPNGIDTTTNIFHISKYVLVMANAFPPDTSTWYKGLLSIKNACHQHKIPLFFVTSMPDSAIENISKMGITILKCDATIIKTAARVNATYFIMQKATILQKKSYLDAQSILSYIDWR